MYRKILDFLFQLIAVRQYLIFTGMFFVLTALCLYILDVQLRPQGCGDMISLELLFTKSAMSDFLGSCGEDGVRAHLILLWVDYIFVIAYVGFMANLLGSLLRKIHYERALTLFSIPIIAGVLDFIENTLLLYQLQNIDKLSGALVFITSIIALVKLILIVIAIVLILYFLFSKKPAQS
ncbi:MAG: hypothetical protein AAF462_02050 [Thermodesulfobacteriota bacterium]